MEVDTTIEGRERYRINVRYPRELRDNVEALRAVLVPIPPLVPRELPASAAASAGMPPAGTTGMVGGMGSARMGGGMSNPALAGLVASLPSGGGPTNAGMAGASMPSTGGQSEARAAFVPLGQLTRIETVMGPPMIKSELGQLTGWVYVDLEGRDVGGYVDDAKAAVARLVKLPPGYSLKWTGQYELLERVRARLAFILPLTIGLVFTILYLNFRGVIQSLIVMLGVPFAAVGAVWLLYALRFNTSIAVWVGMIALLGVAAETTSVMVVYLDQAWKEGRASGAVTSIDALISACVEAGSKRVRPLLMTVMTNIFGLLPVLLDTGVGADVAKRIAAPMWGGLVSLTVLTLLVAPAVYVIWRSFEVRRAATPAVLAQQV
jgi:Cu(I)/Ag(I) efflux system membrane protein CusA/SilA